jgi:hypothetical protein
VLVFVIGDLAIDPASALTAGELAKLLAWCLTGDGMFIEYELETTGTLWTTLAGAPVRLVLITRRRMTRRTAGAAAPAVRVAGRAAGVAGGLTSLGTAMCGK